MIQVVGIGPGRREGRTIAADDALRRAEVIVGYTTYVELVRDEFAEKRFVTTGMRGEKERCVQALLLSREGRRVALICSGDAQVYGMASWSVADAARPAGQYTYVSCRHRLCFF